MAQMLYPGGCQEQILDHKQPKKKKTQAYNEIRQDCLRPRDSKERSIADLDKITRGLQGSIKNSLSKITHNRLQLLFI